MDPATSLTKFENEFLLDMYRRMNLIRFAGETMERLVEQGEVPGSAHLYTGQEAVAVGACFALRADDRIVSTHRSHGHVLAKGTDVNELMAEFGGKENGICSGRGGEMHMFDAEHGVLETTAIVGAHIPHLAGAMLADRLDDGDRVGVAFFGDGASNQGILYETMNMASIWSLPMIFLCENNQYAVSTSRDYAVAGDRISDRAAGFEIPGRTIDGQDVIEVYETVKAAVDRTRNGAGPEFIECETYRVGGHYSAEEHLLGDRPYRTDEEIERWRDRDPIRGFAERLLDDRIATDDELAAVRSDATDSVDAAVEFMRNGTTPSAERALDDVYTNQGYPALPAGTYR